jgi:hypothetical protein
MKIISTILLIALVAAATVASQKKQKGRSTQRKPETVRAASPPMIGTQVVVTTKNGDRIKGELLDLSPYSIKIRADRLESVHALESIQSVAFGSSAASPPPEKQTPQPKPDFGGDLRAVLGSLDPLASATRAGTDFADYGRLLTEVRPPAERFIQEYSISENPSEARAVALIGGALTDYSWARIVWTLKLGRSSGGLVGESDSPLIGDVLALYPNLRAEAASGSKFSGDKLIAGLWKKAAEKTERARLLTSQPQQ